MIPRLTFSVFVVYYHDSPHTKKKTPMKYGLQKLPISDSPIDGSLTEDLRYLRGGTDGIEWLILYEEKFGLFENRYTMLQRLQ